MFKILISWVYESYYAECELRKALTHWGRVTHICVCKLTIIGSDNGLSPGRRPAIIWTNAHQNSYIFIHENALENVVRKLAAILSRPQCVNSSHPWMKWPSFHKRHFQIYSHNEKCCILIRISWKFVPKGLIDNKSALVQVMAWCQTSDRPLSEPMLSQFTDIYVALVGRWVKRLQTMTQKFACWYQKMFHEVQYVIKQVTYY